MIHVNAILTAVFASVSVAYVRDTLPILILPRQLDGDFGPVSFPVKFPQTSIFTGIGSPSIYRDFSHSNHMYLSSVATYCKILFFVPDTSAESHQRSDLLLRFYSRFCSDRTAGRFGRKMADDDGFYDDFYTGYDGFEEPEAVSFNDNWSDAPSDEVKEGNTAGGEPEEKFEIKTIAVKDTLGNVRFYSPCPPLLPRSKPTCMYFGFLNLGDVISNLPLSDTLRSRNIIKSWTLKGLIRSD